MSKQSHKEGIAVLTACGVVAAGVLVGPNLWNHYVEGSPEREPTPVASRPIVGLAHPGDHTVDGHLISYNDAIDRATIPCQPRDDFPIRDERTIVPKLGSVAADSPVRLGVVDIEVAGDAINPDFSGLPDGTQSRVDGQSINHLRYTIQRTDPEAANTVVMTVDLTQVAGKVAVDGWCGVVR